MKNLKKTLALVLVVILAMSIGVAGTLAYLTDSESITNTFTVGNVAITLDEKNVDGDVPTGASAAPERDMQNDYALFPGGIYVKDPTVHIQANSEECFLFVKVVNNIAAFEENDAGAANTIATQMDTNGWTRLEGVENVYVYAKSGDVNDKGAINKVTAQKDIVVFSEVKIDDDLGNTDFQENGVVMSAKTVEVTAYAIQADGMTNAADAWTKGGFGGTSAS